MNITPEERVHRIENLATSDFDYDLVVDDEEPSK
jgi:hypothetical protein